MINNTNKQSTFNWTDVGSCHQALEKRNFYGLLSVRYEAGKIVLIKLEETLKPSPVG